jgi:Putative zinc-finger
MQCSEFDALLSQAIDGTLAGERLTAFETHASECKTCGPLLQEAEAGRSWLKSLDEVEPPAELVTNILVRTTGIDTVRLAQGRRVTTSWMDRVRELAEVVASPIVNVARQPRFAMSFGMAFFTLSVGLSLAGVRLSDLRHVDLRPSAIRRNYYETSGRVVKYYENIRFVYEMESRVRQFKQAIAPAEQPPERRENNNRKENKNNSSGQPDQKQERNYSGGEGVTVYASLRENGDLQEAGSRRSGAVEPPVVPGATDRRFV